MSNKRAAELWRRGEPAGCESAARRVEVSRRRKDHEVEFFERAGVVRRHLKPVFRFLRGAVGRRWADVSDAVERLCRDSGCPRYLRERLLRVVVQQVGLSRDGRKSVLYPTDVFVDAGGRVCR